MAEAEESDELLDMHYLTEREVVWAVSVPGESPFVAEVSETTARDVSAHPIGHY